MSTPIKYTRERSSGVCVKTSLDMNDTILYGMEIDINIVDSSDEFDIRNEFCNVSADAG